MVVEAILFDLDFDVWVRDIRELRVLSGSASSRR